MSARTRLVATAAILLLLTAACSNTTPEGQDDAAESTSTTAQVASPSSPPTSSSSDTVVPSPPTFEALSDAFRYGDDPDLDRLWDECAAGSGKACDDLYLAAPLDSEYEEFGYTCGDRRNVIICTEIDDPTAVP